MQVPVAEYVQIGGGNTGRIYAPIKSLFTFNIKQTCRQIIREVAAEFTGVMILIIFGTGVVSQVVLSSNTSVALTPKGVSLPSFSLRCS